MFQVENIVKIYGNRENKVYAINHISFCIKEHEVVSIVGASGSGKSTLMNLLSTLDQVTDGTISYQGRQISALSQKEASKLRLHEFGFVFQKYYLMPTLNVYDNIVLSQAISGKKIDKEFLQQLVSLLELEDKLTRMPEQLSGGQQQRVAIARALIHKPKVVFADEPTGNLDSKNGEKVIELLLMCAKQFQQTVVYVTHDQYLASKADRIIMLKDGAICEG